MASDIGTTRLGCPPGGEECPVAEFVGSTQSGNGAREFVGGAGVKEMRHGAIIAPNVETGTPVRCTCE